MKTTFLRSLGVLALVALLSCGGGGGADGDASQGGAAVDGASTSTIDWGFGSSRASPSDTGGNAGSGGDGNGDGGSGVGGSAGGTAGGGGGDSSASASAGDGSGVGSGGTGASASAGSAGDSGVGGVGGVGSIIVNGVRYDTGGATLRLRDVPALRLGMTAKVIGPTNSDFTTGTAFDVESAVDIRGAIVAIDRTQGSFTLLGTTVQTDTATVLGNILDMSTLAPGDTVQVWGLPTTPGAIRATRVERLGAAASPIVTGTVQSLQAGNRVFRIGALTIDATSASIPGAALVEGMNVRVRAAGQPSASALRADSVELWYPVSQLEGTRRELGGVVTDFAGLQLFRVLGVPVDVRQAQVSGGLLSALDNGAELDVAGTVTNGVLVASTVRIRKTPGGLNTTAYSASGPIGGLRSLTRFNVRGQTIDASAALLQLVGGTLADLRNGARVTVTGDRVVNDVLIASRIVFDRAGGRPPLRSKLGTCPVDQGLSSYIFQRRLRAKTRM